MNINKNTDLINKQVKEIIFGIKQHELQLWLCQLLAMELCTKISVSPHYLTCKIKKTCHTIGKVILAPKLYGKKKKNQKAQHDLMQSNYNLQAAH